jgi:chromosome segregation ATPase
MYDDYVEELSQSFGEQVNKYKNIIDSHIEEKKKFEDKYIQINKKCIELEFTNSQYNIIVNKYNKSQENVSELNKQISIIEEKLKETTKKYDELDKMEDEKLTKEKEKLELELAKVTNKLEAPPGVTSN